jgi:uncharacterized membrane protein
MFYRFERHHCGCLLLSLPLPTLVCVCAVEDMMRGEVRHEMENTRKMLEHVSRTAVLLPVFSTIFVILNLHTLISAIYM